jgi:hypothetical protein
VGTNLKIEENPQLPTIGGFDSLTSVGDEVKVVDNVNLTALPGLFGLQSVGGRFEFRDNIQLPTQAQIQALLDAIGEENVGDVQISGNGAS